MNAPNDSKDAGDPGARTVGCIKWMLAVPLVVIGVLSVLWGMVCLVLGGPEGSIGEPETVVGGLVFLVVGLVFGGVGYLMIISGIKKRPSDIEPP